MQAPPGEGHSPSWARNSEFSYLAKSHRDVGEIISVCAIESRLHGFQGLEGILLLLLSRFSCARLCVTPWRVEPTRLLCPWNSPGKSTGVGNHSLLQGIFLNPGIKSRSPVLQANSLPSAAAAAAKSRQSATRKTPSQLNGTAISYLHVSL